MTMDMGVVNLTQTVLTTLTQFGYSNVQVTRRIDDNPCMARIIALVIMAAFFGSD